jgi:hypothetical protein
VVSIKAVPVYQCGVQNVLVNNVAVLPAELTAETADGAVLAAGLEAKDTESLGDDHALLVVVGRGDTLEGLEAVHGGVTTLGLVRDHATDGAPEHLGRRTVVPWTTARRVETGLFAEESLVLHYVRSRVSIRAAGSISSSVGSLVRIRRVLGPGGLVDVRLARKNSPEMLSCSQRTTTTFWPFRSCLATVEARRPRRWPLPSTTTCVYPSAIAVLHHIHHVSSKLCGCARRRFGIGDAYHRLEGRHFAAVSTIGD